MDIDLNEVPVQIISLKASDILVLRAPAEMDLEDRMALRELVVKALIQTKPKQWNPVIVIEKDVDIAILEKEQTPFEQGFPSSQQ